MKLHPIAMIRPNSQFIYAPSRIRKAIEKDIAKMTAKALLVSLDGINNPQPTTAYANGSDCWYIEVK